MNRKLSTLMAISLMALSTSAFADNLPLANSAATKVEGKKYFLIQNVYGTGAEAGLDAADRALGMKMDPDTKALSYDAAAYNNGFSTADGYEINNYLWEVTQSKVEGEGSKYYYSFKNVATGELLRVHSDAVTTPNSIAPFEDQVEDANHYNNGFTSFVLGDYAKYSGSDQGIFYVKGMAERQNRVVAAMTFYGGAGVFFGSPNNYGIQLYEATDVVVEADALNNLYNSNGFNLQIPNKDNVTNIFNDGRVKAIKVPQPMYLSGNGVTLSQPGGSADYFGIPAGTYFAVETPGATPTWDGTVAAANELYDFLLQCTLIAADPTENMSSSASLRKDGEGFAMTTVSGKDLSFYMSTLQSAWNATPASQKPSGSTISVRNACFTVKSNINQADKYAISLGNFFYQKTSSSTDQAQATNVQLALKSNGSYGSSEYLVTVPGAGNISYLFKFVESNMIAAADLLSADGASIYNIQFVGGKAAGSYLTDFNTKFYAKGDVLADLDAPEFQYLITKVSGNEVTFTNRATGQSLVTKLFDEGDDVYSFASTTAGKYDVLDLDRSNSVVTSYANQNLNGAYIQLLPVLSVDKFYGFLDVANETPVTLAFARDNAPTSNTMYPTINTGGTKIKDLLTDEISEAAQWQLVKSNRPTYKTRTYAYLNADDKVAYKSKGDTIAYYTYELQLVNEGDLTNKYLGWTGTPDNNFNTLANNSGMSFIIKENLDGSVNMFNAEDGHTSTSALAVKDYETVYPSLIQEWIRTITYTVMSATPSATDIKTYLVQDAPEVSLPATVSYVTLETERGNYISMNEDNDGIVVNNDPMTFRLFATDLKAVVPSFLISTGFNEKDKAREFLFNPQDSVQYYVGAGQYDKEYQWSEDTKKAIFKSGILNETNDTLTTSIKGKLTEVATNADRTGVKAGLNRFKFQIVLADGEDDLYYIRQLNAGNGNNYLANLNGSLTWENKQKAVKVRVVDTVVPTANEAIAAEAGVQVIGGQGVVTVQGAAGKVVTVANILGQTIANQVAASDNVTIAAPAGIVVVAVDGEATKVVVK